jgi:formiminotetrahydrofolate cyclodeaminase
VSALAGALAGALGSMVSRLTVGKKRYAEHEGRMRSAEESLESLRRELFDLVGEDARAYESFRAAGRLSQRTPEEIATRDAAMREAARHAARVPLRTAETCVQVLEQLQAVAAYGNENALSDAAVAGWLARAGAEGAVWNVTINLPELPEAERAEMDSRARRAAARAEQLHAECVEQARRRLGAAVPSA